MKLANLERYFRSDELYAASHNSDQRVYWKASFVAVLSALGIHPPTGKRWNARMLERLLAGYRIRKSSPISKTVVDWSRELEVKLPSFPSGVVL